ncbi:MAG: hypothetical protein IJ958_08350 [Agathobacter sp.]|nr:hypothetical protein [Agathobacter sp.]
MKKRNVLLALALSVVMLLTACGNKNPFVGTWRGTWDFTDAFEQEMLSQDPTMEQYLDFENLTIELVFEFTEDGEMEMNVDEDSLDAFVDNMETGIYNMMDAMLQDQLSGYGLDNDQIAAMMGYDSYDAMMQALIAEMDMQGTLVDPLMDALDTAGTYEYDEEDGVITLEYEEEGEEEFEYEFDDEKLILNIEVEGYDMEIECEKEK